MSKHADLATHEWSPRGRLTDHRQPVVVLVHGVTGWHRTWWRVGPALAERGWRVVAVDQRGHGRSPRIEGHASVSDLAADLGAVIDRLGGSVDALIGHSLGAAVSAELVFLRPDTARRLVLEDPPAASRATDSGWLVKLEREILAAVDDPAAEEARERAENPSWLAQDVTQNVEGRALADRPGIVATFRRPTGARVPDLVARLAVPTLYLLGAEDRSVYTGPARHRLEAELPAFSRLEVIDAGHTIHRDRFEDWMTAVIRWLEPAR